MILLSHNELVTLAAKAYRGLNRQCGEPDRIANMVADLEMVGLNGIKHFLKALEFLETDKDIPPELDSAVPDFVKANLHGCSILCHLPALLAYAMENLSGDKAATHDTLTLQVENCHNRWLAYGELTRLAEQGYSIKATWSNGSEPKHIVYILNSGQAQPDIYLCDQQMGDLNAMTIEVSKQPINLGGVALPDTMEKLAADELAQIKQASWQQGIEVYESDWHQLKKAAGAILVETSEISEKGAGE